MVAMVNESITLPTEVLQRFLAHTFIETGSYDGRTIQQALDVGFQQVKSVELSEKYYGECARRFVDDPRVKIYKGESYIMLPLMMADLEYPATFWLDAHIQEGVYGTHYVPLMLELMIIRDSAIDTHTIMIDDKRLMGTEYWGDLSVENVVNILYSINKNYVIEYIDSKAAEQDIIVAHI